MGAVRNPIERVRDTKCRRSPISEPPIIFHTPLGDWYVTLASRLLVGVVKPPAPSSPVFALGEDCSTFYSPISPLSAAGVSPARVVLPMQARCLRYHEFNRRDWAVALTY